MKNKNVYIVILAGGSGTRFWPLSRHHEPKQFLKINGSQSLLQQTLSRVATLAKGSNTIVVTNKLYVKKVKQQLKSFRIPSANILWEPEGKNTAPAIAWAASLIAKKDPNAIMVVLPSDHLIKNTKNFLKDINHAVSLARKDYLVTFGIVPNRPETGYGYIKAVKREENGETIYAVERFVEKPDLARAQEFLKAGNYVWNSGMFIWKASEILKNLKIFLPNVYDFFAKNITTKSIQKNWRQLPSISIDFGILEKANNVLTVPANDIGWSDLGSWEALIEVSPKDKKGNIIAQKHISVDCENVFIHSDGRIVACIGLENVTVVDTPDAILICKTQMSQKIKDVVAVLKTQNRPEWLKHQPSK